jgi:hypothetical protein
MIRRPSRRGPRCQLIRENDGTLYDLTNDRPIEASELRNYLSSGGYFEAKRADGSECTGQVLREILEGIVAHAIPWAPGALVEARAVDAFAGMLGLAGTVTDSLAGTWGGPLGHTPQRPRPDRRRPPGRPRQTAPDFDDQVAGARPRSDPNPA